MSQTVAPRGSGLPPAPPAPAVPPTRVVAHRGFHDNVAGPYENSLLAFEKGIKAGVDVLETDVFKTKDNVLVLHHDPEISGKNSPKIADLTYDELPRLPDGQRIPKLAELLDMAKTAPVKLAVEIKEPGYEEQIVRELQGSLANDRFEVISFTPKSIEAVERLDPSVRTGMLGPRIYDWMRESALFPAAVWVSNALGWHTALNRAERIGADYVSVDHRMATTKFVTEAAKRGLGVDVWTVNDEPTMQRLLGLGVQGIVTDRPDVAMRLRDTKLGAALAAPSSKLAA